uniref:Protein msta, isoform B n=1 Tax=Bactrocera dorsalis TaxID=27457 RepID=A0A034WTZ4_BACDO
MLKWRIVMDPLMGRSLVTTEIVKKGEMVVEESPFAIGPKQNSGIVCLGCYRDLFFGEDGDSLDRCERCDWPLCSACFDIPDHLGECEIFTKAKVHFAGNVSEDGVCTQLDCITPLSLHG